MRWVVVLAICGVACGRFGFDSSTTDALGGTGAAQSTLRLDRIDPGETLVDFPLPVVLDDSRIASELLDASDSNLRFLDSAGNVLAHELEQIGHLGGPPVVAWVRVPTIVGLSTTLTIEVGGALPPPSTQSVWSASYEAVYHLSDGAVDATAHHHDGAPYNANAIVTTAGVIASGQSFGSQSNAYVIPDAPTLDVPELTVSGWLDLSSTAPGYQTLVSRAVTLSHYDDFWLGANFGTQRAEVAVVPTTDIGIDNGTVASTTWSHFALTADAVMLTSYIDGVAGTRQATGAVVQHDMTPVLIGADEESATQPNANFLAGAVDEIRIEHGVRSDNWIRYDDDAQRDRVITYGPVQR